MPHLPLPDSVTETSPAEPRPAGRGGHWAGHVAGLALSLAVVLWSLHWLARAQLWAPAGQPNDTGKYVGGMLLLLPGLIGLCFFVNRLGRGRWLLWLAAVLLGAECLLLAGALAVLHALGSATARLDLLLALGVAASLGAAYYVIRQLRLPRPGSLATRAPAASPKGG